MAIEEKAANSRQSVDLKWKLRKALEEQVSEASDGSGIEFGKDVTVDGKLHVNEFSDIQNAKGEGLVIYHHFCYIDINSKDNGNQIGSFWFNVESLRKEEFQSIFEVVKSQIAGFGYYHPDDTKKYMIGFIEPSGDRINITGVDIASDVPFSIALLDPFSFRDRVQVPWNAKPNPGQWDEEE